MVFLKINLFLLPHLYKQVLVAGTTFSKACQWPLELPIYFLQL